MNMSYARISINIGHKYKHQYRKRKQIRENTEIVKQASQFKYFKDISFCCVFI